MTIDLSRKYRTRDTNDFNTPLPVMFGLQFLRRIEAIMITALVDAGTIGRGELFDRFVQVSIKSECPVGRHSAKHALTSLVNLGFVENTVKRRYRTDKNGKRLWDEGKYKLRDRLAGRKVIQLLNSVNCFGLNVDERVAVSFAHFIDTLSDGGWVPFIEVVKLTSEKERHVLQAVRRKYDMFETQGKPQRQRHLIQTTTEASVVAHRWAEITKLITATRS